ncbi:MAG: alpha-amylase family protein [Muribaculaceae bacterium]|nr:alpha-amylase family protein [Muribaculaceae bacterium]
MAIKPIIYQLLPRLFSNANATNLPGGTIEQNGSGKMNDITPKVLKGIKELGCTHVWYTGVIEHAHDVDYTRFGIQRQNPHIVKGKAGSPYAITDYYDIDPDIAVDVPNRMGEFEALVERTHKAGMKVIIDFVPNHVARQYYSDVKPVGIEDFGTGDNTDMFFSPTNNFYYITRQQFAPHIDLGQGYDAYVEFPAKASGNDCFTAFPGSNDWYETVKLNYGYDPGNGSTHFNPIPPTWFKMLHILRYWASKGVDGFRCDMAHMVPVEFWRWAIRNVKNQYPDVVFIAEIYDVGLYRCYIYDGGFDYLYDKVNLYDTLRGIETMNYSAATLTSTWQTVEGVADNMLNFLENHDEQRFASDFYAGDARKVVPSLVVSSMINRGPFMLYMGQELGEPGMEAEGFSGRDGRTTIFDFWSISTIRRWLNAGQPSVQNLTDDERQLRDVYARILTMCNKEKAISQGAFFDVMYVNYESEGVNPHRNYIFLRSFGKETLIICANFADYETTLHINMPQHAFDMLALPQGKAMMKELLSGAEEEKFFTSEEKFVTKVAPYSAVIWKVKTGDIKPLHTEAHKSSKKKSTKK